MNLEQTFRSAVGTMRWRIKFVVLGLAVIFGAQLYVRSQAILFSAHDMALSGVESSAPPHRLPLPGAGLRAHGTCRGRRVPLAGGAALVAHGAHRRRLPLHRRRPGASRAALRRSGELPVPGVRRAAGHGRPGGAAALRPPPPARPRVSSSATSGRRSTIPSGIWTELLAAAGQGEGRSRPLRVVGEVRLRDLRGPVGHRVAARRGEGAARGRDVHRADERRRHWRPTGRRGVGCGGGRTAGEVRAVRPGGGRRALGRRNCGSSIRRPFPRRAATAGACP